MGREKWLEICRNAAQHHSFANPTNIAIFANPTNIANANPKPPTPADRVVPVNGWPLDRRTLWAGFAWSAVRNQSEIETSKMRGTSPFLFVILVQQRRTQNHAKPAHRVRRASGQPFTGTTRSAGVGGWVSVGDIGRVGKKMVLRRIPIYLLSTIFHVASISDCRPFHDQMRKLYCFDQGKWFT